MKTAYRAACPGCKTKVTVTDDGTDLTQVTCEACGKKFALRIPKYAGPMEPAKEPALSSSSLPDFGSVAPMPMDWNSYGVKRKPLIAAKPLAIAVGVVAALAAIVVVGSILVQQAKHIDLAAVSGSLLQGPEDTHETIAADWRQYVGEQKKILDSIERKSDCDLLRIPLERLEEKYLNLIVRGALLENAVPTELKSEDLAPAPSMQEKSDKSFRTTAAFLTAEFLEAETKINTKSGAVLSYLHVAASPLASPINDFEKSSLNKILIKRAVSKLLAEAHRSADESKTAVAIYELTEELKKLKKDPDPAGAKIVTTLPPTLVYADFTADQMRRALAERFSKDSNGEIAKGLTAFEASL